MGQELRFIPYARDGKEVHRGRPSRELDQSCKDLLLPMNKDNIFDLIKLLSGFGCGVLALAIWAYLNLDDMMVQEEKDIRSQVYKDVEQLQINAYGEGYGKAWTACEHGDIPSKMEVEECASKGFRPVENWAIHYGTQPKPSEPSVPQRDIYNNPIK